MHSCVWRYLGFIIVSQLCYPWVHFEVRFLTGPKLSVEVRLVDLEAPGILLSAPRRGLQALD